MAGVASRTLGTIAIIASLDLLVFAPPMRACVYLPQVDSRREVSATRRHCGPFGFQRRRDCRWVYGADSEPGWILAH